MNDSARDTSHPTGSRRVAALFAAALERPPEERRAFLEDACSDAPEVRAELTSLLAAHEAGDAFPAIDAARALLLLGSDGDGLAPTGRVGPYRVVRELGQGGMGAVYLGERADGQFEHQVALKLVRPGMDSEAILRRFLAERQILARLRHDNIARLLEGGVTEELRPWLAMEYVEGTPLVGYCDDRRLGVAERLRLFRQVCDAVHYAHRNLIVHRDLKPSNILVTDEGTVKLLDFGIAKLLDDEGEAATVITGVRAMTPEYAAPEQVRGDAVTTATDVYSLGVVLYELLTGSSPYRFESRTAVAMAKVICEAEPMLPSAAARCAEVARHRDGKRDAVTPDAAAEERGSTPRRLRRQLEGDLDKVILKALRKEPERRYASAQALAEDLERYLTRLPVRARPDTLSYRAGKFIRRHRLAVAASVTLVLSLAAGLVGTAWQGSVAARERDRAEREARSARQVKDYVLSLFEASDPTEALGPDVTARELLDRGAERLRAELAQQPALQAEMLQVIGDVNVSLGEYEEGLAHYERAVELRLLAGTDPLALADAIRSVGQARHWLGDYGAAASSYRRALEVQRREVGDDGAEVAGTLNDLAVTLVARGDPEAAEPLYRRSLAIQRRELGDEDQKTIDTLANLATLQTELGDYQSSAALSREALELQKKVSGDRHPWVAHQMSNLGTNHSFQGEVREAEELHREALAIRLETLGPDHPAVGGSLNNLAAVLRKQGRFGEAESLARQLLELERRTLGDQHPFVAMDLEKLGLLVAEQGRLEEAWELIAEARELRRRGAGADRPRTAASSVTQGIVRLYQGRLLDAERLLTEASDALRSAGGPSAPKAAVALAHLGAVQGALNRHQQARRTFAEALEIQRRSLRPGHPDLVPTLVGLGEALLALGRPEEAEPLLQQALDLAEGGLPPGHWRIALAQSALGEALLRRDDPWARDLLRRGFEGLNATWSEWHPATRKARQRLPPRPAPVARLDSADADARHDDR